MSHGSGGPSKQLAPNQALGRDVTLRGRGITYDTRFFSAGTRTRDPLAAFGCTTHRGFTA
jgi:hypothetical protein